MVNLSLYITVEICYVTLVKHEILCNSNFLAVTIFINITMMTGLNISKFGLGLTLTLEMYCAICIGNHMGLNTTNVFTY